jgi:chromosome segregation ATPase
MIKNTNITATREDIEKLKTDLKKQLNRFATKDDLNVVKQDVSVLKQDVSVIKNEIKDIKNLIGELGNYIRSDGAKKDDFVKLRNELKSDAAIFKDEIVHDYVKVQEDFVVVNGWGDKIEDHEERITKLEDCSA